MTPQTPALGIMLQKEFTDSKFYKISCDCGSSDCEIDFSVEVEPEFKSITLCHYTTQYTLPSHIVETWFNYDHPLYDLEYKCRAFIRDFINRCKLTRTVWIDGYVKTHQTTIMNEQQVLNYITTLQTAMSDLKTNCKQ